MNVRDDAWSYLRESGKYNGGNVGVAAAGGGLRSMGFDEDDDSTCSWLFPQGNWRNLNQGTTKYELFTWNINAFGWIS